MSLFLHFLSLTAFSAHTLAAPGPLVARDNDVACIVQDSQGLAYPHGPVALRNLYTKYNISLPADIESAAVDSLSLTNTSHVTNQPQTNDFRYLSPMYFGIPGTRLRMDFDTGSSTLWTFSTLLSDDESAGHRLYNLTGEQKPGQKFGIGYGDGSFAQGKVYSDVVRVGDINIASQDVRPRHAQYRMRLTTYRPRSEPPLQSPPASQPAPATAC